MRRGRRLLFLAGMAAVLSAAQGAAAQGDVTTITFSGNGAETFMNAQLKVIELFEAAHPNIKVKFEPAPGIDAEQGAILRLGQGDSSLDVVTTETGYEYQWFKNGWLESLTPYFTQDELDQIDAHLLENVTFEGQMLAAPVDNATMYLAVNQDLLETSGVTPPPTLKRNTLQETVDGVWTWEQVLEAAKQVKATTGKTGLLFPNDEAWILAPMGQQLGGEMFSPDGLEVKGYLDQAPWVDAATRWGSFFEGGASAITTPEWNYDQFVAGESAFALMHIGLYDICEGAEFDCDAAAQPYFEGGDKAVQSAGSAWAINAASQHKAEAAEFLKFALLDPGAQAALVDGGYFAAMPMTKAGVDAIMIDPAYQQFPKQVRLLGAYQFQNWPQEMYRSPANATFFTSMSDAFENVRVGAQTPEQAVLDMTDKVDRDLDAYR